MGGSGAGRQEDLGEGKGGVRGTALRGGQRGTPARWPRCSRGCPEPLSLGVAGQRAGAGLSLLSWWLQVAAQEGPHGFVLSDACSPPPAQGLPGASDAVSVTCTQSRSRATKLHRPLERDRERESPAQEGRMEGLEAEWLMRLTSESNGAEMARPDSLSRYK